MKCNKECPMWQRTMHPNGRCLAGSRVISEGGGYDCNLVRATHLLNKFSIWINRNKMNKHGGFNKGGGVI